MRIAIVGSRDYPCLDQVAEYVAKLSRCTAMIVTGGARGVDQAAEEAARIRRISRLVFEPTVEDDFSREALITALHARNDRIVVAADRIVAFWDGNSRGTRSVIGKAERAGKPVDVLTPDR